MNPVIIGNATLHLGDCIEVMAGLPSERELLKKKVFAQLESMIINEWVSSEVALSYRYEQIGKAYRGQLKNKIADDG